VHLESVIGRRLSGAFIFALALLVQLMLPFAAAAQSRASSVDPLGGGFVICTHDASAETAPAQPSDTPRPHCCDHCTLCQGLGGGVFLMPPVAGAIAARTIYSARLSWQYSRASTARLGAWPAAQPRAPPSLA